jgi:hypothetical protein
MKTHRTRSGFALIEVAVSLGIIVLIFGSLVEVNRSTLNAYAQTSAETLLQSEARRALDRVSAELENGGLATLQPNPVVNWTDNLVFQACTGVDPLTGAMTYGTPTKIAWVLDPGELMNGIDDNGNGLIDEGELVLTRNYNQANPQSVVIAHNVANLLEGEIANHADDNGNGLIDERGFCIIREGNLLHIRLTLQRSVKGKVVQATVETGVRLRN